MHRIGNFCAGKGRTDRVLRNRDGPLTELHRDSGYYQVSGLKVIWGFHKCRRRDDAKIHGSPSAAAKVGRVELAIIAFNLDLLLKDWRACIRNAVPLNHDCAAGAVSRAGAHLLARGVGFGGTSFGGAHRAHRLRARRRHSRLPSLSGGECRRLPVVLNRGRGPLGRIDRGGLPRRVDGNMHGLDRLLRLAGPRGVRVFPLGAVCLVEERRGRRRVVLPGGAGGRGNHLLRCCRGLGRRLPLVGVGSVAELVVALARLHDAELGRLLDGLRRRPRVVGGGGGSRVHWHLAVNDGRRWRIGRVRPRIRRMGDRLVHRLPRSLRLVVLFDFFELLWQSAVIGDIGPLRHSATVTLCTDLEFHILSFLLSHTILASRSLSQRLEVLTTPRRIVQFICSVGLGSEQGRPVQADRAPASAHDALLAEDLGLGRDDGRGALPAVLLYGDLAPGCGLWVGLVVGDDGLLRLGLYP